MKVTSILIWMMVPVVAVACSDPHRPEPFGKMTGGPSSTSSAPGTVAEWAADCEAPLSIEGVVRGPDPLQRYGPNVAFQAAAMSYVCPHPGWSVYVDRSDRIVGVCVDDLMASPKPYQRAIDRARVLLARHVSDSFAADITEGNVCSLLPQRIAHGLQRWTSPLRLVIGKDGRTTYHPSVGTLDACCWEVIDP